MTGEAPSALHARIASDFARQRIMALLGAELGDVAPGAVTINLPIRDELMQQDGFLHAGITATVLDSASGYAALSLMPPGHGVLSIEFKVHMLAPAVGERLVSRARVIRAGRRITTTLAEGFTPLSEGGEKMVALMTATMTSVEPKPPRV